jgi:hypothetical protein
MDGICLRKALFSLLLFLFPFWGMYYSKRNALISWTSISMPSLLSSLSDFKYLSCILRTYMHLQTPLTQLAPTTVCPLGSCAFAARLPYRGIADRGGKSVLVGVLQL